MLFRRSSRKPAKSRTRLRARAFKPRLEQLEERLAMAVAIWDGGSATSDRFSDPANWVGDVAPLSGDDLIFAAGAHRNTATVDYGDGSFRSTTFESSITIRGATVDWGDIVARASEITILNPWHDPENPILQADSGSRLTLAGVISGPGGLEKVGGGTLVLTAANTYQGRSVVREGVLNIQHNAALGSTAMGTDVFQGASLQLEGGIAVGRETLTLLQGVDLGPVEIFVSLRGNNSWAGDIAMPWGNPDVPARPSIRVAPWGDPENPVASLPSRLTLSGVVSGTAGLEKVGNGTLVLGSANTYQGRTVIREGVVNIRHGQALGIDRSGTDVVAGAGLELEGGITVRNEALRFFAPPSGIASPIGLRSLSGNNSWTGPINLWHDPVEPWHDPIEPWGDPTDPIRVDTGSVLTLSGVISEDNRVTLEKRGAGALILSGANSYSGVTELHEGALLVQGKQPASPIMVFSGSLGGVGTTGPVTLASGALHYDLVGARPPRINVQGTVQIATAAVLDVRLDHACSAFGITC